MATLNDYLATQARQQDDLQRQFTPFPDVATHLQFFNENITTVYSGTTVQIRGVGSSFVLGDTAFGKLGTTSPQSYLGDSRPGWTTSVTTNQGSPFLNKGREQIRDWLVGSNSASAPSLIVVGSGTLTWHGSLTALSGLSVFAGISSNDRDGTGKLALITSSIIPSQNTVGGTGSILTSGMAMGGGGAAGSYFSIISSGSLSTIGNTGQKDITVECWVKTGSGGQQMIIEKFDGGGYPFALRINDTTTDTGIPMFAAYDGVNFPRTKAVTLINDSTWHHLAGVRNSTTGSIYIFVDGIMEGSLTDSTAGNDTSNTAGLGIGNRTGNALNYFGSVDEVRISGAIRYSPSNFTVSTTEFSDDTSTVALWHLNSKVGSTVTDSSSNGFTGVVSGNASIMSGNVFQLTASGANTFTEIAISGGGMFTYDTFSAQTIGTAGSEIRFIAEIRVGS